VNNEKLWDFAYDGTLMHAYLDGESAACRKSITRAGGINMSLDQVKDMFPFRICGSCLKHFETAEQGDERLTHEYSDQVKSAPAEPCASCGRRFSHKMDCWAGR